MKDSNHMTCTFRKIKMSIKEKISERGLSSPHPRPAYMAPTRPLPALALIGISRWIKYEIERGLYYYNSSPPLYVYKILPLFICRRSKKRIVFSVIARHMSTKILVHNSFRLINYIFDSNTTSEYVKDMWSLVNLSNCFFFLCSASKYYPTKLTLTLWIRKWTFS